MTTTTAWRPLPPRSAKLRKQANGELVCRHRDLSCCNECRAQHREILDVYGACFWMASEAEADDLRREMAENSYPLEAPPRPVDTRTANQIQLDTLRAELDSISSRCLWRERKLDDDRDNETLRQELRALIAVRAAIALMVTRVECGEVMP